MKQHGQSVVVNKRVSLICAYILDTLTCGLAAGDAPRTIQTDKTESPITVTRLDSDRYKIDQWAPIDNARAVEQPSIIVLKTRTGYTVISYRSHALHVQGGRTYATPEQFHFDALTEGHMRSIEHFLLRIKAVHKLGIDAGPRTV